MKAMANVGERQDGMHPLATLDATLSRTAPETDPHAQREDTFAFTSSVLVPLSVASVHPCVNRYESSTSASMAEEKEGVRIGYWAGSMRSCCRTFVTKFFEWEHSRIDWQARLSAKSSKCRTITQRKRVVLPTPGRLPDRMSRQSTTRNGVARRFQGGRDVHITRGRYLYVRRTRRVVLLLCVTCSMFS